MRDPRHKGSSWRRVETLGRAVRACACDRAVIPACLEPTSQRRCCGSPKVSTLWHLVARRARPTARQIEKHTKRLGRRGAARCEHISAADPWSVDDVWSTKSGMASTPLISQTSRLSRKLTHNPYYITRAEKPSQASSRVQMMNLLCAEPLVLLARRNQARGSNAMYDRSISNLRSRQPSLREEVLHCKAGMLIPACHPFTGSIAVVRISHWQTQQHVWHIRSSKWPHSSAFGRYSISAEDAPQRMPVGARRHAYTPRNFGVSQLHLLHPPRTSSSSVD
jgi:hypothetical protein